jgi:hypothetical protein
MSREYPKMLYRADGAVVATRTVTDATQHEAATAEGWGDRKSAQAAADKAPKPAPAAAGEKPSPDLVKENLRLVNEMAVLKQSATEAIEDRDLAVARAASLETFLKAIGSDEKAPEGLRTAIADLLGEPAPAVAVKAVSKGKK